MMNHTLRQVLLLLVVTALLPAAHATTYRWKDPVTGRLVISDEPPPPGVKALSRTNRPIEERTFTLGNLPLATRKAVEDFPVVLYTANDCLEYCADARGLLNGRGVPFTEMNASDPANMAKLRAFGEAKLPTLTVGAQAIRGFERGEWHRTLGLAGYPEQAPLNYRSPPPPAPVVIEQAQEQESIPAIDPVFIPEPAPEVEPESEPRTRIEY